MCQVAEWGVKWVLPISSPVFLSAPLEYISRWSGYISLSVFSLSLCTLISVSCNKHAMQYQCLTQPPPLPPPCVSLLLHTHPPTVWPSILFSPFSRPFSRSLLSCSVCFLCCCPRSAPQRMFRIFSFSKIRPRYKNMCSRHLYRRSS